MMPSILIIGGYGALGSRIAELLVREGDYDIIIAGRHAGKAKQSADLLGVRWAAIDITKNLEYKLEELRPSLLINASGLDDYHAYQAAEMCIDMGIHYIDLSASREFVVGFTGLDDEAKAKDVVAIAGAGALPAFSSAIFNHTLDSRMPDIFELDYGITIGNQSHLGVASINAFLRHAGQPFTRLERSKMRIRFGWQKMRLHSYPELGARWLCNYNAPELTLLPEQYSTLRSMRFGIGLELGILHWGLWAWSWLTRCGILRTPSGSASALHSIHSWFRDFGSNKSAMHMRFRGVDFNGNHREISWHLIATHGDGVYVPAAPAVVLARAILSGHFNTAGAHAAMGLASKEALMDILKHLRIREVWS